jgi:hypothetical protein
MFFFTKSGECVALHHERTVFGDRGPYVEFKETQIDLLNMHIPQRQLYRINDPKWIDKVYYVEYRTNKDNVKVYFQKRLVSYADYKIGMYYISPDDLLTFDGENLIKFVPTKEKENG